MTEAEWQTGTDPSALSEFLMPRASARKLILFACACCRRAEHLLMDPRHRAVLETAERFSDGLASEAEFHEAMQPVIALWRQRLDRGEDAWEITLYLTGAIRQLGTAGGASFTASYMARGLACLTSVEESPEWFAACQTEAAIQCDLLRDTIGDPFRPFQFDPVWLTGAGRHVAALARSLYDESRFHEVPLLAEALEQAGYGDQRVLDHCRRTTGHVRGCWVVDALLGSESAVRTGPLTEADWYTCNDPWPLLHILRSNEDYRKWRLYAVACCRRIHHLLADERSRQAVDVAARYADGAATDQELETARGAAAAALDEASVEEYRLEAEENFCITPRYAGALARLSAARAAVSAVARLGSPADTEPGSDEPSSWDPGSHAAYAVEYSALAGLAGVPGEASRNERRAVAEAARAAELCGQCDLLRDLFGEWFGPPAAEGAWLPWEDGERWCQLPTQRLFVLRSEWLTWNDGTVGKLARAIYDEGAFERLPILADALLDAGCDNPAILAHCRSRGAHVRGCWVVDVLLGKNGVV